MAENAVELDTDGIEEKQISVDEQSDVNDKPEIGEKMTVQAIPEGSAFESSFEVEYIGGGVVKFGGYRVRAFEPDGSSYPISIAAPGFKVAVEAFKEARKPEDDTIRLLPLQGTVSEFLRELDPAERRFFNQLSKEGKLKTICKKG